LQQVLAMGFHGVFADRECTGDLLRRKAFGYQLQYFFFAGGHFGIQVS